MAGPWEKYAATPLQDTAEAGPWTKFGAPAGTPPAAPEAPGLLRKGADLALDFTQGVLGVVSAGASLLGAPDPEGFRSGRKTLLESNPVAYGAGEIARYAGELQSDARKAERQGQAERMQTAEATGSTLEEIKAGAQNFFETPGAFTASAVGSLTPTLAAAVVSPLLAPVVGAGIGAGNIKLGVAERVRDEALKAGRTPEEAAQLADQAQAYTGENWDQIALGGLLGGVTGAMGAERFFGGGASATKNVLGRVATGAVTEAVPEGTQGGQERLAANIAAQRGGFGGDTWTGVAGQGTTEALASTGPGGIAGAMTPYIDPNAGPISRAAIKAQEQQAIGALPAPGQLSGEAAMQMGDSVPGQDPTGTLNLQQRNTELREARAEQESQRAEVDLDYLDQVNGWEPGTAFEGAQQRLAQLEQAARGTPDQEVEGPDGQPAVVPGIAARAFSAEEQQEYDVLRQAVDANPRTRQQAAAGASANAAPSVATADASPAEQGLPFTQPPYAGPAPTVGEQGSRWADPRIAIAGEPLPDPAAQLETNRPTTGDQYLEARRKRAQGKLLSQSEAAMLNGPDPFEGQTVSLATATDPATVAARDEAAQDVAFANGDDPANVRVFSSQDLPDGPSGNQRGTGLTRSAAAVIEGLGRVFGTQYRFYDSPNAATRGDGFVLRGRRPGVAYVRAVEGDAAPLVVAGHETYHTFTPAERARFSAAIEPFVDASDTALLSFLSDYTGGRYQAKALQLVQAGVSPTEVIESVIAQAQQDGVANLDRAKLREEFDADIFGNRMKDTGFWEKVFTELKAQDRTLLVKIRDSIKQVINYLKSQAGKVRGFDTDRYIRDLDAVQRIAARTLLSAANTQQKGERGSRGAVDVVRSEVRDRLGPYPSESFANMNKDWYAKKEGVQYAVEQAADGYYLTRTGATNEGQGQTDRGRAAGAVPDAERRGSGNAAPDVRQRAAGGSEPAARQSRAPLAVESRVRTDEGGRVSLTGIHFSRQPRLALSGSYYGTGLKGAEGRRLAGASDRRLLSRVYAYVNEGKGVKPESGVGAYPHTVELSNLYDFVADPLKLIRKHQGDLNAVESAILDEGFDGYYVRDAFGNQGAAVVLGDASIGVEATPVEAEVVRTARRAGEDAEVVLPTRWPTAVGAKPSVSDPMLADLDTLRQTPKQLEQAVNALVEEPGMRTRARSVEGKLQSALDKMEANLLWLHDLVPADIRARSKLWYEGAGKIATRWAKQYGKTRSQAAGILAVLSPQKDWFMNVTIGERVLDILSAQMDHRFDNKMKGAAFQFLLKDRQKLADKRANSAAFEAVQNKTLREVIESGDLLATGVWLRAYDEAHHAAQHAVIHPEGDFGENATTVSGSETRRAWGGFDALGKAASIFIDGSAENINAKLGGEHKVRNFYNNIYAPKDARFVTIDTHAVAADLLRPLAGADKPVTDNFGKSGGSNLTGVSGTYPIHYEAYKRAAEARGILPREMQSITWEAVRGLFTEGFKGKKENLTTIDNIWRAVDQGKRTIDEARTQILEKAGGIKHPDWWGGKNPDPADARAKSYQPTRPAFAGTKVVFEVAPDPNDRELTRRWNDLSDAEKRTISYDLAWDTAGQVLAFYNSDTIKGELHTQVGGYLEETNPSFSLWVNKYTSQVKIQELARVLGFVLKQDSMVVASPKNFKGATEMGAVVVHNVDDGDAKRVYDELRAAIRAEDGSQLINGHTTAEGGMAILVDLNDLDAIAQRVADYLGDKHDVSGDVQFVQWPERGEDEYGLLGSSPDLAVAPGSPLRTYADRLRAETEARLEQRIREAEAGSGKTGTAAGEVTRSTPEQLADPSAQDEGLAFSLRRKPAPEKTVTAYKLFRVDAKHPGQLFPLFVDANTPVEAGVWYDADVGELTNTGKVKSKIGPLAYRPGWHAGDLPIATHIGGKSAGSTQTAPDFRLDNQVWAEVEMAADVDWQSEANRRGTNAKGKIVPVKAHIADQVPEDGYYRYKTNPNMTGNWLIGGSMRVTRILSDAEVERINAEAGTADLPRQTPFDSAKYGFDATRSARRNALGFYSQLSRAVEGAKFQTQPAGQWKMWLSANAGKLGVKADEVQWSGINDWLDLQGRRKVEKVEVLQYLEQGGVQVEDVQKGGARDWESMPDEALRAEYEQVRGFAPDAYGEPMSREAIIDELAFEREEGGAAGSRYGRDRLVLPGGENYREVLLTLPAARKLTQARRARIVEIQDRAFREGGRDLTDTETKEISDLRAAETKEISDLRAAETMEAATSSSRVFHSSHWDEVNVLAHMRLNDRTTTDGRRVLFVEEIQSDWGQAGRDAGFGDVANWTDAQIRAAVEENDPNADTEGLDRATLLEMARNSGVTLASSVPAAPFVQDTKSWVSLALKRVISMAAEGGYDAVAVVNGQQSADRYSLREQIESVSYDPKTQTLTGYNTRRAEVLNQAGVAPAQVADYVGKEVAQRLLATELSMGKHLLSGEEIEVGGDGMKAFYDRIVPQVANVVLKKLGGGKVAPVPMRMPYRNSGDRNAAVNAFRDQLWSKYGDGFMLKITPDEAAQLRTLEQGRSQNQLGFDITPAMRETVTGDGLPLFSAARTRFEPETHRDFQRDLARAVGKLNGKSETSYREGYHQPILVMRTPPVLRSVYERAKANSRPFRQSDSVVGTGATIYLKSQNKFKGSNHGRPVDGPAVQRLPQLIADPLAVFQSTETGEDPNSFKVLGADSRGFFVAAIKPGYTMDGASKKTNFSATIFPVQLGQVTDWVKKGALRYWDDRLQKAEAQGMTGAIPGFLGPLSRSEGAGWLPGGPKSIGEIFSLAKAPVKIITRSELEGTPEVMLSAPRANFGDMTQAQEDALRAVGLLREPKTIRERFAELTDNLAKRLTQGVVDQYAPLKELDFRSYVLARMSKGTDGTFEAMLYYGRPQIAGDTVEIDTAPGGLMEVLSTLSGEQDRFLAWIAANRADQIKQAQDQAERDVTRLTQELKNLREMRQLASTQVEIQQTAAALKAAEEMLSAAKAKAQVRELLFTDEHIQHLKDLNQGQMADGRGRQVEYARVLREFNAFQDSVLAIAEARGLIDAESRQVWRDGFYVPFYRNMEDGTTGPSVKSGLVNQYAFKKLKGSSRQLNEDLLANTLQNMAHLLSAASKNQAAAASLRAAESAGVAHRVPSGTKGAVRFLDAGREQHYLIDDPFIYDAITSLESVKVVGLEKVLSKFKHWLTMGVTINPAFQLRSLMRDAIQSVAITKIDTNPLANVKQGIASQLAKDQDYINALASGGLIRFNSLLEGNRADHTRKLIKMGVADSTVLDTREKVEMFFTKALDKWLAVGDISESTNRMALYKQLIAKGEDPLLAAYQARDLMDFSMQGQWRAVRFLTQVVPFLNARLQGLYKLGRDGVMPTGRVLFGGGDATDKQIAKRFGAVTGAVAMASIALMAVYADDEDWKKREDWDRDTYWWFKIGDTAFRIPKPFEVGAIGTIAERTAELFMSDDLSGDRFLQRLGHMMSSTFALNPIPQMVKPLLDVYANEESFTQRPIETMGMERLQPQDRFTGSTSEVAKWLGQLGLPEPGRLMSGQYQALSPVQIDALIRGYFSWLGVSATRVVDMGVRAVADRPARPEMQLRDVFFAGNFVEGLPANSSRYVTALYDQSKAIESAYASYRFALRQGDQARATELLAEDGDKIRLNPLVTRAKQTMSKLNENIRAIERNLTMSPAEKRAQIDRIKAMQNQIAMRISAQLQ